MSGKYWFVLGCVWVLGSASQSGYRLYLDHQLDQQRLETDGAYRAHMLEITENTRKMTEQFNTDMLDLLKKRPSGCTIK